MLDQQQTFRCQNCKETINATTPKCRFCGTPVDRQAAVAAGEIQGRVNRACSDASYLKAAAMVMWALLGLSFIPIIPAVGWGFLLTFIAVLVMLILWHIKFGDLQTGDEDYPQAKRDKNLALALWLAAIPVGFVLKPLLHSEIFSLINMSGIYG